MLEPLARHGDSHSWQYVASAGLSGNGGVSPLDSCCSGVVQNEVRAECRSCGNGSSKSSTASREPFKCACSRASSNAWNGVGLAGAASPCHCIAVMIELPAARLAGCSWFRFLRPAGEAGRCIVEGAAIVARMAQAPSYAE